MSESQVEDKNLKTNSSNEKTLEVAPVENRRGRHKKIT